MECWCDRCRDSWGRFTYPAYYATDGKIVGAVERSPGAYLFVGVQTLFWPANSLAGTDHPFVWASGADLSAPTWTTELSSTFDQTALTTMAGGGVAIVGAESTGSVTFRAFLLELGAGGALVQASAYSTVGGPGFASISTTSTPGFAIGGKLGGALAMSTKADGTVAGTCYQGFASSISVTLQPFTLLTTPGILKVNTTSITPTTATLSTVTTDGFTLTSHCH
jgi:hypothetical protein